MEHAIEQNFLSTEDFIVIALTMAISAGIGLYFRFAGGQQKTNEEYLMAGKNMSIFPVAFSLMATFMSTATLMGIPTEMYLYGTHMAFMNVGVITGVIAASYIFIPVYFSSQVSTSYEYIQKRFGPLARTFCSFGFAAQATLYMGVVLYTPALALSAVTNLSTWTSVISIGTVCTFYCTIGGMKAVIWTDMFQALLMFTCIIIIIIKGTLDLGGISNVFHIADEGGRLVLPSFSMDPSLRYTFWNILFQGFFMCCSTYGTSQLQVQRMLSVKNSVQARKALFASLPITVGFHVLCCLCGIIFYASFHNCDPLSVPNKPITSADQLMPYFIMSRLSKMPGLPGLCICGIFAASVSTLSSLIQTLTVVTIEDFLVPLGRKCKVQIFRATAFAKAITCCYGLLGIVLTFMVAAMGNVVEVTIALFGVLGGPLLGLFFLAALTKRANEKGAVIGMIVSFSIVLWFTFGPFMTTQQGKLLLSVSECVVNDGKRFASTLSYLQNVTTPAADWNVYTTEASKEGKVHYSHMWITPIGVALSVTIGYISSLIIQCMTGEVREVEPQLICPIRLLCSFDHAEDKKREMCELTSERGLDTSYSAS